MNALTPFVLCADDNGLTPGVSPGIRALLQTERLSVTSRLVTSPHWPTEARKLRALPRTFDIGLHLTLGQLAPVGPMPRLAPKGRLPFAGRLVILAYAGKLDADEIAASPGYGASMKA